MHYCFKFNVLMHFVIFLRRYGRLIVIVWRLLEHISTFEMLSGRSRSKLCTKLGSSDGGLWPPENFQFFICGNRWFLALVDGEIFPTFIEVLFILGSHIPQKYRAYCPNCEKKIRSEATRFRLCWNAHITLPCLFDSCWSCMLSQLNSFIIIIIMLKVQIEICQTQLNRRKRKGWERDKWVK